MGLTGAIGSIGTMGTELSRKCATARSLRIRRIGTAWPGVTTTMTAFQICSLRISTEGIFSITTMATALSQKSPMAPSQVTTMGGVAYGVITTTMVGWTSL